MKINPKYYERNIQVLREYLAGKSLAEIIIICKLRQPRPTRIILEIARWIVRRVELAKLPLPFKPEKDRHLFYTYEGDSEPTYRPHGLNLEDVLAKKEFFTERLNIEETLYYQREEIRKASPPVEKKVKRCGSMNLERDIAIVKEVMELASHVAVARARNMTDNNVRLIFTSRVRWSMRKVIREGKPHPYTFEKHPHLYIYPETDRYFNVYRLDLKEVVAQKEFFLSLFQEQLDMPF